MTSSRWAWRAAAPILLIGALLRLAGLGVVPPGLHPDEASVAVEARSLWETGRTTEGVAWPLSIPMHDRYRAEAPYVWLAAPCAALPLSVERWVRLPAALFGVLLLPLVFALARRLLTTRAALVALAFFALEPQAWHYGRLALRATLVPTFLVVGLLLLSGPTLGRGRARWIAAFGAGVFLSAAALTYTPGRVVVPLLACGLCSVLWRRSAHRAPLVFAAALPCFAAGVALPWSLGGEGAARVEAVAVWSQAGPLEALGLFLKGYALQFSPRLLFWGSSSRGFWAEGVAPLLAVEVPLVLVGVAATAVRAWRGRTAERLLMLWLLIHPLAAALTVPSPNPLRAIFGVPLWALLAAQGARSVWGVIRSRAGPRPRVAAGRALALCVVLSSLAALQSYFVAFPAREGRFWFAQRSAALRAVLRAAEEEGAGLRIEVDWLEASLVRAQTSASSRVVGRGERVVVEVAGAPTWTGRLSAGELVLERPDGTQRIPLGGD